MQRLWPTLAILGALAACSEPGTPLDPDRPTTPEHAAHEDRPLGPARPYGINPALGSQSEICPSRCAVLLDLPAGATPVDVGEVAEVLAHDATGPLVWSRDKGVTRVGSLGGATTARVLTNWGYVAGGSRTSADAAASTHAFFWTGWGGTQDLGTLGGPASTAWGSNDDGSTVVGGSQTGGAGMPEHAFLWTPGGGMRDLGTLRSAGGAESVSRARAVNANGQVVGQSATDGRYGPRRGHAFLWTSAGGMRDLGTLPGYQDSRANGLNAQGWVVGASYTHDGGSTDRPPRAFVWIPGSGMRDLGTLGGDRSEAFAVSDWGEVVGTSTTADGATRAFVWHADRGMTQLDNLGRALSLALDINSWGDILGIVADADGSNARAVVWTWEDNVSRWGTPATTTPPPPPPPPSTPGAAALTITFDDGWESTYTVAYPILRELGMRANVGVVTSSVSYWTGFLTLPQLRELQSAGWSMVSHSVTHPNLANVSDAVLERELRDSQQWLRDNGFGSIPVFIVPFHSWGSRELSGVKRHYQAARGYTSNYFWPEEFQKWPPEDPYRLTSIELEYLPWDTPTGRETLKRKLDHAVANGYFVDLLVHQVRPDQVEAFRETMRIVAQYKQYVRTYGELFPPQ